MTVSTLPAPVAVCSCGTQYDQRTFDAQRPAAGYEGREPYPVMGLIWRLCGKCESSVCQEVEEDHG